MSGFWLEQCSTLLGFGPTRGNQKKRKRTMTWKLGCYQGFAGGHIGLKVEDLGLEA